MVNLPAIRSQTLLPEPLRNFFRNYPKLAIAFSGGIDSRFLCHAALLCGCDVLAIHAAGPHIAPADSHLARGWALLQHVPYKEIFINPLELQEVKTNSRKRCYICKKNLFRVVKSCPETKNRVICEGSNTDDHLVYRPGTQAVQEAGIISPLARAGLSKKDIYKLAHSTGLDLPSQKARPCLLTRLPYGMRPDKQTLARLAQAELAITAFIEQNCSPGLDFRLRLTPEPVLHLTAEARELHAELKVILKENGFENGHVETVQKLSGFFDQIQS